MLCIKKISWFKSILTLGQHINVCKYSRHIQQRRVALLVHGGRAVTSELNIELSSEGRDAGERASRRKSVGHRKTLFIKYEVGIPSSNCSNHSRYQVSSTFHKSRAATKLYILSWNTTLGYYNPPFCTYIFIYCALPQCFPLAQLRPLIPRFLLNADNW